MEKYKSLPILLSLLLFNSFTEAQTKEEIRIKQNNPGLIVDLGTGLWSAPIPVDFNGDGLMDIIMSCPDTPYKGIYFFKNIGTSSKPLFDVAKKVSDLAYKNTQASYVGDDLHVISEGTEYAGFVKDLFASPNSIPVDIQPAIDLKKVRSSMWSYVDFDNDGDQDILVGIDDWGDYGWDNAYDKKGKWTNGPLRGFIYLLENRNGKYLNKGKLLAGSQPLETYGAPGANMADFDRDGKKDIICGEFLDKLSWYRNIGTPSSPKFDKGRFLLDENSNTIKLHTEMITPVAVDFDKDGKIDLVVGDEDGRVTFIQNTGKVKNSMPVFKSPVYLKQKADYLKFGALTTPYSIDWDSNGNEDIISGNSSGNIGFIKNLSGGVNPKWAAPIALKCNGKEIRIMAGENGSIQGPAEEKWGYTTLSVADWDNDGKKDLIVNSIFGKVIWYRNKGDLVNLEGPYSVKVDWGKNEVPKPEWNWWNPGKTDLVTQWRTTPFALDWNKDGLTDLIMLNHEGFLSYYERERKNGELWLKPGRQIFYIVGDAANDNNKRLFSDSKPLQLATSIAGRSGRRKLCFVDWNNDGRLDLMVNSNNACYYENIKQNGDTVYFKNKGDISQVNLAGHDISPTPVDWDKDGRYDLLIGAEDGHFYIVKNNIKK
ncbi:MAG: VCBS repeat-containing protein [Saprospiraceae bacterium]